MPTDRMIFSAAVVLLCVFMVAVIVALEWIF